jgi:hypothetical protein
MEIKKLISFFYENFSKKRCMENLINISLFDRIQLSKGLNDACSWVKSRLDEQGIENRLIEYEPRDIIEGYKVPKGWKEIHSTLEGLDYEVIKGSKSLDLDEYEVVDVGEGTWVKNYRKNVENKLVLCNGDVNRVARVAIDKFKAAGIISYAVDNEYTKDFDAIAYKRFSDYDRHSGFTISYNRAMKLKKIKNKIKACIKSRTYKEKVKLVEGKLGKGKEGVLGIAHLCHPKFFANDNASGCASLLESCFLIRDFLEKNQLKMNRFLSFLFVPELLGTIYYLNKSKNRFIAGINLDMVGENQFKCNSPLLLEKPPFTSNSFTPYLLSMIFEEFKQIDKRMGKTLAKNYSFPLYMIYETPFSGGSDHLILCDPLVNIPTPMLVHWPDGNHHMSSDNLDKISAEELKMVTTLASTYLLSIAIGNIKNIGSYVVKQMRKEIIDKNRTYFQDPIKTIDSIKLVSQENVGELIKKLAYKPPRKENRSKGMVPQRIYKQPWLVDLLNKDWIWKHKEFIYSPIPVVALYLCDGKRSVYTIHKLLEENDLPCKLKILIEYFKNLEECKAILLKELDKR